MIMYRETNKQILEEIARLNALKAGQIIGKNNSRDTTVKSLGKFYSNVLGHDLYIGLKEYERIDANTRTSSLNIMVACELGVIDLVAVRGKNIKWIQFTTMSNIQARRRKILKWKQDTGAEIPIEVWGWCQKYKKFKILNV